MLFVKLNGSEISESVNWPSLSLTSVLTKEVDRFEFRIKNTPTKTIPVVGDEIELLEGSVIGSADKLFGGVVVEQNAIVIGGRLQGYDIRCKDWSYLLDRKLVIRSYAAPTGGAATYNPSTIAQDIIDDFTTGFTTTNIQTAVFNIVSIKFNYEPVTRALTLLSQQIGWDWYVDPNKDIHFFAEETASSPFNLTDENGLYEWATLEVNTNVMNLKNTVIVRGGSYKKTIVEADAVDSYKATTGQKTFSLAYQYSDLTVELNGVVQSIGTDQQTDPGTVDVLYNFTEKFITFTSALASGDSVVIYGDALIPIIARVRDQISIDTYGVFEQAIIDKSITSIGEAQSRARAELIKYSASTHEARFKTEETGLRVGQTIRVQSTVRGIDRNFKIIRIIGKPHGYDRMIYEVFLLASGQVTFTDIMVDLLGRDKKNVEIADNEVLEAIESFNETLQFAEVLGTPTTSTGPYEWGAGGSPQLYWGLGTWA